MIARTLYIAVVALCLNPVTHAAGVVYDFRAEAVNDSGPNTASVIVKLTAEPDQITMKGGEVIGINTVNIRADHTLGADIQITATSLVPGVTTAPGFGVSNPNNFSTGNSAAFSFFGDVGTPDPTFASLFDLGTNGVLDEGENMIDLFLLEIEALGGGFVAGANDEQITLTIELGEETSPGSGLYLTPTALGPFGDPENAADPLFMSTLGASTTLAVAIPEPSSFLFLGLVGVLGMATRWTMLQYRSKSA